MRMTFKAALLGIAMTAATLSGGQPARAAEPHFGEILIAPTKEAIASQPVFPVDTATIFLNAQLIDMPVGTKLTSTWIAVKTAVAPPDFRIDSAEFTIGPAVNVANFSMSKPKAGWPVGAYRVDLLIDGKPATSVPFEVK